MMRMLVEEAVGRSGKMRPPGKAECSLHICGWQGKEMNLKENCFCGFHHMIWANITFAG